MKTADALIQAGHEGRTSGATGAESQWGSELEWNPIVADEATRLLTEAGIQVIREDAFLDPDKYRVSLALFLHFDGSGTPCASGASIGYDDRTDKPAADQWKELYSRYWPFRWMSDNFTTNLKNYYGYQYTVTSDAELVLELGELTCREQALWLKPRLKWLGNLIAHFVSSRLGKGNIPDPGRYDPSAEGTPGWLELYDLSLHADTEAATPNGAYIKGSVGDDSSFEPTSEILGEAVPKPAGVHLTPGWMELEHQRMHRFMDSVSPIEPYVNGALDNTGHFYPNEPYAIIGITDVEEEPDRPDKRPTGQKYLWYPDAEIMEPGMKTRGVYQNSYPAGAIVHFTAGRSLKGDKNARNTLNWGRKQGYAYFVISNTGNVFQAHPLNEWGSHAGASYWPELGNGVSKHLVGIEICCAGKLDKVSGNVYESWFHEQYSAEQVRHSEKRDNIQTGWYHKFTEAQEKALAELLLWLKSNNPDVFNLDYVLGHDEVAPNRKNDPGASLSMSMPEFREKLKRLHD